MKLFLAALLMSLTVNAHEGHNHDAPKTVKAPKGGIIKQVSRQLYMEVVSKSKDLTLYFYDSDLTPKDMSKSKVIAYAMLPRKKTKDDIALIYENMMFKGSYDAKGAHRYNLTVKIESPDINEELSLNIEPRK